MSRAVSNGLNLQAQRIINLADGTGATDAVNKQQMDGAIRGLDWKPEVVAASTGNVSLAAPGASLDGVALVANDRVLLKDQTAPAENGIYVWTGSAAALTRALDADTGPELSGSTTTVQRGTVNADRVYRVTSDDPLTIGTTAVTWVQVGAGSSAYLAGNGLVLTGSTFDVVPAAGGGITVTADAIAVDSSLIVRKMAANNAAATSTTVAHNFGSRDVQVTVFDNATFEEVLADVVHTDLNSVTVTWAVAPAAGAFRIVVQG